MIKIKLNNGKINEYKKGITAFEVSALISKSLSKSAIVSLQDNNVVDLLTPIEHDLNAFEILTDKNNSDVLSTLNHSTAHILAKAILNIYPEAKLIIGPSISEGFYYDVDLGDKSLSESDLLTLEKEMKNIVSKGGNFIRKEISRKDLLNLYKNNHYKTQIINELNDKKLTTYTFSEFEDLCKGPHLLSINKIKNFKLTHISGAYFKGDSKNKMITRIYGTSFFNSESLQNHLLFLKSRKENDHRKIGRELNLFGFEELSGKGFPFWYEDGLKIKNRLKDWLKLLLLKNDYIEIETPIVGNKSLYITSGHLLHYKDTMFPMIKFDDEEIYLRPMSCPHHCLYFKKELRSYNDLPLKISEDVRQFRYEKSGAIRGLERVRAMELTDGHLFVLPSQIKVEIRDLINLIQNILKIFEIEINYIELSLRDPSNKNKYHSDSKVWNESEEILKDVLDSLNIEYKTIIGEAAFYGPKIDIQVKTNLNHIITMSTIQLDFLLPKKFNLFYKESDGKSKNPILIHRGLIGTYERFISILLEQSGGVLPFWLSPKQITLIPILNKSHLNRAIEIKKTLIDNGILNVNIDKRDERLNYKIREAQKSKSKYQIVIGDNEIGNNLIVYREYGKSKEIKVDLEKFIKRLKEENELPKIN